MQRISRRAFLLQQCSRCGSAAAAVVQPQTPTTRTALNELARNATGDREYFNHGQVPAQLPPLHHYCVVGTMLAGPFFFRGCEKHEVDAHMPTRRSFYTVLPVKGGALPTTAHRRGRNRGRAPKTPSQETHAPPLLHFFAIVLRGGSVEVVTTCSELGGMLPLVGGRLLVGAPNARKKRFWWCTRYLFEVVP